MKLLYRTVIFIPLLILSFSCKKYLDQKPDQALAIPTTLQDFQGILNQNNVTLQTSPGLGDLGSDDYYVDYTFYQTLSSVERASYIWDGDIWQGTSSADWTNGYATIYKANVVIDGIKDFQVNNNGDQVIKNSIYGSALFIRAFGLYSLEEIFGQPYKKASSNSDLGIPLKLSSNLNQLTKRANVQETYDQVIFDLQQAVNLLPNTTLTLNQPTKATAYAMLARVYLSMQDYLKGGLYADSSLQINNLLVDYNTLNASSSVPFTATSPFFAELLYPASMVFYTASGSRKTIIDSTLFNSYVNNDLRKSLFFRFNTTTNTYSFKGIYSTYFNNSPTTDEMYLTRAECYARNGNTSAAMLDLNSLLKNRWKTGTFVPFVATDNKDALKQILNERRKELCFRGLRWIDLRRLNQDSQFAVTLKRIINGQVYTLSPNDPKYTYPIPPDEIQLSGIEQNAR